MGNRSPTDNETAQSDRTSSSLHDAVQTVGLELLLDAPPELHESLANESRQAVLEHLSEDDGQLTVLELAERLVTTGVAHDRRHARTALHHIHLPKLADNELIEWNRKDGVVSLAVEKR